MRGEGTQDQVEAPAAVTFQREPQQYFAALLRRERSGYRALDDLRRERLDLCGTLARQAATMLAVSIEIFVQFHETEPLRRA